MRQANRSHLADDKHCHQTVSQLRKILIHLVTWALKESGVAQPKSKHLHGINSSMSPANEMKDRCC